MAYDNGNGNGKSNAILRWLAGLVLAAIVSYFTAISAITERIAVVEERENNHYMELLRRLDRIELKLDRQ